MPDEKPTSIKVKPSTRNRLAGFGKKTETFDGIINRLLDEVEACRKKDESRLVG